MINMIWMQLNYYTLSPLVQVIISSDIANTQSVKTLGTTVYFGVAIHYSSRNINLRISELII